MLTFNLLPGRWPTRYFLEQIVQQFECVKVKDFSKIFNVSEIPSEWKIAIVISIFKKGNSADPGNYRPVSLTCTAVKAMEAIISQAMVSHLVKNNLISAE